LYSYSNISKVPDDPPQNKLNLTRRHGQVTVTPRYVNQFIHFSTLDSHRSPEPHNVGKGMPSPSQGATILSDNLERRPVIEFWDHQPGTTARSNTKCLQGKRGEGWAGPKIGRLATRRLLSCQEVLEGSPGHV